MKKYISKVLSLLLTAIMLIGLLPVTARAAGLQYKIDETNFPDANFRNFVKQYDLNSNGYLTEAELQQVYIMSCRNQNIASLQGIELFEKLEELDCSHNNLNFLDLRGILPSLDVLDVSHNGLTSLQVEHVGYLYCNDNSLSKLDAYCFNSAAALSAQNNRITYLDLRNAGVLHSCYTKGSKTVRDTYTIYREDEDYALSVDNSVLVITNSSGVPINNKTFPAKDFRTAVQKYDKDKNNKLSNMEINAVKSMKLSFSYEDPEYGISLSMEGIGFFTALENLECECEGGIDIDLTNNLNLKSFTCTNSYLTYLDLRNNKNLEKLNVDYNSLHSLDLRNNQKLARVSCKYNELYDLLLDGHSALENLECSNNRLTSLAIRDCVKLNTLYCTGNKLSSLDLSKIPALRAAVIGGACSSYTDSDRYTIDNTALLDVDNTVDLIIRVVIDSYNFPDAGFREYAATYDSDKNGYFDAEELKKATIFDMTGKSITSLQGIECFAAAQIIGCADNQIADLDLSLNPKLAWLVCNNNHLQSLVLGSKPSLGILICYGNSVSVLDLKYAPRIAQAVTEGETDFTNSEYDIYAYKVSGSESALQVDKSAILLPKGNPFVDVKAGKFYYIPVLWAFTRNPQITGGTDDTHFSPNETCTRAQVVTFLWRAKGCPEPKTTKNPFKDVKSDKFYYKAVLWAVENKITTGTSDTTFGPGEPCTRGQVVTFLWRSEGSPKPKTTKNPFTDVKSDKYYYKAVLWAVENNITTGTSPTTFEPGKECKRGEVVTFLYRDIMGQ